MRFTPAAIALSMLAAVTSSAVIGADYEPDQRAAALIAEGHAQLEAGDTQAAIDSFEAALTIDPGYTPIYLNLAEAARRENLQGKAIHYYRAAQERDPENIAAISGEGEALAEKGAMESARRNLTRLEELCGNSCEEATQLAAAIDRGPIQPVITAEAISSDSGVTQN
ncbi:tetratricopeptide repeat protein [Alteraurantiacibacter aestuarii]|uniref:tetratricopeptide repeat protein n=1 Tax=Alteraurantiacibacter aestuarii TaxID=650004 RepID=UPI0031E018F9